MKRMILAIPLLLTLLAFINAPAADRMTGNPLREEAVVEFTELVKLQGVLLRGQYLIYHDDEMMESGKPCLNIYTMKAGKRDKLVISIHCEPVARERAAQFTVTLGPRSSANALREVREIQFAGMAKGHRIPS